MEILFFLYYFQQNIPKSKQEQNKQGKKRKINKQTKTKQTKKTKYNCYRWLKNQLDPSFHAHRLLLVRILKVLEQECLNYIKATS